MLESTVVFFIKLPMHYSLLLCFTLHIVLTVITPISLLNITVQDFVNIRKALDVLVLTVTMTECFILFFFTKNLSKVFGTFEVYETFIYHGSASKPTFDVAKGA